jgi:hypothetical protein
MGAVLKIASSVNMTLERTVTTSAGIVAFLSTIASKCYLITSLNEVRKWRHLTRVPALVIPDILLMLAIGVGLIWILDLSRRRNSSLLRYFALLASLLHLLLASTINSIGVAYYQMSGALVQWRTAFDFLIDFRAASSFFVSNSGPTMFWIWLHVFLFGVVLIFRWKKNNGDYYSPLLGSKAEDTGRFGYLRTISSVVLLVLYTCWAVMTGPRVGNWRVLSEPQLVAFSKAVLGAISDNYFIRLNTVQKRSDKYSDCETILSMYEVFTNQRRKCGTLKEVDYSFLRRTPESEIKNVIWIYLESARSDILPFNKDSPWVKENLNEKIREENPFSQYFSGLIEKGLYFENFRTISTYTLKSLLGGLCSVIPLPVNRLQEWDKEPYRKCLPRALSENGWETLFMEPGTADWEHQRENLYKIGFNTSVAVEEMDAGIFVGKYKSRFHEVNYFGKDDIPMIDPLLDWLQKNRKDGKPSFATLLTNVNHDPYQLPDGWKERQYITNASSEKVNKYLNTARYTDEFLKKIVGALQANGTLKDTLLVVMGDHGMALGEHNRVGTNENSDEPMIKVPCFIYSENEKWRKKYPPKRYQDVRSSLDMFPTILDMINEDPQTPTSLFTDYYEGSSLIRRPKESPLHISFINPGAHSTVFWENNFKAVLKNQEDAVFHDLRVDPTEDDPKAIEDTTGPAGEWFKRIINFNELLNMKTRQFWNSTSETTE